MMAHRPPLPTCSPPAARRLAALLLLMAGMFLAGCASVGPDYQRPAAATSPDFKESHGWTQGQPQDQAERGPWWEIYRDPVLNGLVAQVAVSNQTLKADEAAYREAAAIVDEARSGYVPAVGVSAGATRSGVHTPAGDQVSNQFDLSADASWTIDVWGKIRRQVESDVASAQASAAELAAARLSTQATLASDYMELRSDDELKRLLDATAVEDKRALDITQNQYQVGVAALADVVQAQTQYQTVAAAAVNVGVSRAQYEHAIAVLSGQPPANFAISEVTTSLSVPAIPLAVPSALLQRRPDISAAERSMAAANAEIGVAIAAYYPDLSISASFGFQSSAINTLLRVANEIWSVGPELAQTVFDGGLRNAQTAAARDAYDQQVALYRQTVLGAFEQVEDALATLRILGQQLGLQDQAVASARQAVGLVTNQYQAGTVSYASVIIAQNTYLSNEQTALGVRTGLLTASVTLIEAMGGGWTTDELPQAHAIDHRAKAPAQGPGESGN